MRLPLGTPALALVFGLALAGCSKPQPVLHIPVAPDALASAAKEAEAPGIENTEAHESLRGAKEAVEIDIDPAAFAHVLTQDGHTYVVLHAQPDLERWATGKPVLVSDEYPVITRRDVDYAALPAALTRHKGLAVQLVGASGVVCRGTLGPLTMLGRVEPYYGVRQSWSGEADEPGEEPQAPKSQEEIAEEAWNLSENGRVLAAELTSVRGDCKDALFARSEKLPAPAMTAGFPAPRSIQALAIEAFQKLDRYAEIEAYYAESNSSKPGVLWENEGGGSPTVTVYATRSGTYVWLSANAGMACSDFQGKLDAFWKVEGTIGKNAHLELLHQGEGDFLPSGLIEEGREASPTLLGYQSSLRKNRSGVFEIRSLEVPFLDCPC